LALFLLLPEVAPGEE